MKILFVVNQVSDLVSDPLYIGLVRLLGQDHVVDFPSKDIFHRPEAKRWFLPQVPDLGYSETKICDLLRDRVFDLVCAASHRSECLDNLERLARVAPLPPLVYIDGADDPCIRHDVVARYPIRLYFKRDYIWSLGHPIRRMAARWWSFRWNRALFERTIPLPVSIVLDALPDIGAVPKDVDVSYTGRASHPRRVKAVKILSQMEGVRFEGGVYAAPDDRKYKLVHGSFKRLWTKLTDDGPASESDRDKYKSPDAFYREIARSKIAVAIRGGGLTPSPRYYEIVAMNTLLISDLPEAEIPNNFVHRKHAVFCRPDLMDLQELVRYYVAHDEEREAIARAGYDHLLKHHTCERRAEYFLDICRRMI